MRVDYLLTLIACLAAAWSPVALADAPAQAMLPRIIYVNDNAAPGGNGVTPRFAYRNVPEALAEAKTISGPVIIDVAPGEYLVDSTLVIDRSLVLRGATVLVKDDQDFPTSDIEQGTTTRIEASASLGLEPLISVGRSDGKVVRGVTVRGFVLKHADFGGTELTIRRVQDFDVRGNKFRAPGRFGVETIASSGRIVGNHFNGIQTGAILAAGYRASPSNVLFKGNRSVDNGLGGVLLVGSSVWIPELGNQLDAVVRNNDLSRNEFGMRLFVIFREPGMPGDTQETGHIRARARGNQLHDNVAGFLLDAGFPFRFDPRDLSCDPRTYRGSIDLDLADNSVSGNLIDSWIVFTRWPGATDDPFWRYLHSTTYKITDPQGIFDQAWIDHPERDPIIGPCHGDAIDERLKNVLIINGGEVPPYGIYQR